MPLETELAAVVEAGRAELTFSVVNAGTEPITLRYDADAAAEIAVFEAGDRVWSWREERAAPDAGTTLADHALAPGDTVVHRATWAAPPAGDYEAEASVTASNVEGSARTRFTV